MGSPSLIQSASAPASMAHLTYEEAAEPTRCVLLVKNGLAAFVEAESALQTIRDKQLYRQHFETFEEFADAELTLGVLFTPAAGVNLGPAVLSAELRILRGDQAQEPNHVAHAVRASRADDGHNSGVAGTCSGSP